MVENLSFQRKHGFKSSSVIRKVLSRIKTSSTAVDTIARDLNINKSTVEAMIEFLVREGYLSMMECSSTCELCSEKCSLPAPVKIYVITKKGEEYIGQRRVHQ